MYWDINTTNDRFRSLRARKLFFWVLVSRGRPALSRRNRSCVCTCHEIYVTRCIYVERCAQFPGDEPPGAFSHVYESQRTPLGFHARRILWVIFDYTAQQYPIRIQSAYVHLHARWRPFARPCANTPLP